MTKEEIRNLKAQVKVYQQASSAADYAWLLLSAYIEVRENCVPSIAAKKAAVTVEDHLRCVNTEYDNVLRIYMEL